MASKMIIFHRFYNHSSICVIHIAWFLQLKFICHSLSNDFPDPPGAAKLEYEPSRVVKGGMVTLSCSVARNGLPSSTEFHWYRGNQLIAQEKGPVWIVHSVTLETKANFTCQAVNAGGEGQPDTKYIDVYGKDMVQFYCRYKFICQFFLLDFTITFWRNES